MKIGDFVTNDYHGIYRYGRVKEIKHNLKGDMWNFFDIEWYDDDLYKTAISHRKNLNDQDHELELYRADQIQPFDVDKTVQTLLKMKNNAE
jgi:hypothetical protein